MTVMRKPKVAVGKKTAVGRKAATEKRRKVEIELPVHLATCADWLCERSGEDFDEMVRRLIEQDKRQCDKSHNQFDEEYEAAAEKLKIIHHYDNGGFRHECIGFGKGGKLFRISAKWPLKPGEKIEPVPITLKESLLWIADCDSDRSGEDLPDGGSTNEHAEKWYRLLAAQLEGDAR